MKQKALSYFELRSLGGFSDIRKTSDWLAAFVQESFLQFSLMALNSKRPSKYEYIALNQV
jgi:hypothetical protein